ncbi:MAG: YfaP family protein [Solidesulfovibrio sp. DCME]|uniref:YfaP family protein n=1 Tax=Solidesulfovibrio sp. DCME TaxID=3447380 RepID=UPI003D0EA85B
MKRFGWLIVLVLALLPTGPSFAADDLLLLTIPVMSGSGPGKYKGIKFIPGTSTEQGSQLIPVSGGSISFSQGPLAGVTITVPPNAIKQATTFTIASNSGRLAPVSGTFSGRVIDITTSGQTTFDEPLEITVPLPADTSLVPVPYYIAPDNSVQPCDLGTIDEVAGTVTYYTFHASLYAEIWSAIIGEGGHTSYRPGSDGFQIGNAGSSYNPDGECYGMTGFSLWYYRNKGQGFYGKFMEDIVSPVSGLTVKGQDIIATRAHTSFSRMWTTFFPKLSAIQNMSDEKTYASISSLLKNTKNPVMLYLTQKPGSSNAHAVLAYDNTAYGTIAVYDPNNPGLASTVHYDGSNKQFLPYTGFTKIRMLGQGAMYTEPYDRIYADASTGFHGSSDAKITITSHTTEQQVTDRTVTIAGKVESGEIVVNKMEILLNGKTTFTGEVKEDGSFSIPVSLAYGKNNLFFLTYGLDSKNNSVDALNNLYEGFVLNLLTGKATILVTLTWGGSNTDIDLYVVDPNGDYSCYYHKTTADGGVLDYDIQYGYGPEHWTLLDTKTVRWDEPYKVRVHYYSDHSSAEEVVPVSYNVSVQLYEGTDSATTTTYSGVLTAESSTNTGPNATGPDWDDVVTITPVQPTSGLTGPLVRRGTDGKIDITVPIPPAEERLKAPPAR